MRAEHVTLLRRVRESHMSVIRVLENPALSRFASDEQVSALRVVEKELKRLRTTIALTTREQEEEM